jgi:hypothetical protein
MHYRKLLSVSLLICLFLCTVRKASAQDINTVFIKGIEERTSLEDYLSKQCENLGCRFYFSENLLDEIFLYKTDNGKLLTSFLNASLPQRGITYIVYRDKNIVFIERTQLDFRNQGSYADNEGKNGYYSSVEIGDPMLAGKYKKALLKGFVRNGKTGEPLPGAVVLLGGLNLGVITDISGYYSVEIPVGKHPVSFTYVGFEERELQVNMISPGSLDIELFESTVAIDQVVITSKSDANVVSTEMNIIRLDAKSLKTIPVLMGEPDLMKAMTLLPGIQSSGDMASGFNVRGGNSDQNLILIDGVPIYNSNHLFGLFSIIDTRTIENLELFKGAAPARYGGRISSYMDIDLQEGNLKEIEGDLNLGLFSSKFTLQGPISKEKVSFFIGARTTYSDWILKRVPDLEIRQSRANFYDYNAKLNFIINRNNRISLYTYQSHDLFNLAADNIYEYTNRIGSLRWNHIINDKITYALNILYSDYNTIASELENPVRAISVASGINQIGTNYRLLIAAGTKHSIEAGVEANRYQFKPGRQYPYDRESLSDSVEIETEQSAEFAVYAQDVYNLNSQLSISAGLRFGYFLSYGPETINLYEGDGYISQTDYAGTKEYGPYDVIAHYSGLEPRLGLRYVLGTYSSIKIGYSRNYQYLHMLSNSTVVIPTDTWKSSNKYIKPAMGDQVSIGYFKNFMKGVVETSVELYYKKVHNVLEFKPGAKLVMNDAIEADILSAELDAYGIELLVRKNSGRLTGWLSYTYSRSFYKTSGADVNELINRGEVYPSYFDKPHDLSVVASYKISRRFTFSSTFTYSTGKPTTYPEFQVPVSGNIAVYYSDRNKYRLPDYHRLDASITWDTSLRKRKKFYSSWVLSVYNVYGHDNVYSTYYRKTIPSALNDYKRFAFYELSIIGVPIPSLTYNVRF